MTLEPTARIVLLITAAHAAVLGGWWWMQHAPVATRADQQPGLHWFSPKDMATPAAQPVSPEFLARQQPDPAPPVEAPKSAPAAAPEPPAVVSATKFNVTVSPKTVATSADGNGQSGQMTEVNEAIVDAFKQNWVPPSAIVTEGKAFDAQMDVAITRDGRVTNHMLVKPSGSSQIDMSALRACSLVKRIATPLPAQFSGDSYEVQIHFHAE
jgi:outer membrane biosynthesis protein TonB